MDAAVLEEPPCVCEVYWDCIRLAQRRGGRHEVYIHRIDSSSNNNSNNNGSRRPTVRLSAAAPAASPESPRRSLETLCCWGAFGVSLEPQGGYLLLVETAERVGQIGDAQLLKVGSFRAIDLRLPPLQQQKQQQQRWGLVTRQLRRPLRLRLGDFLGTDVLVTRLVPSSLDSSSSSNSSSSSSSSSRFYGDSPYLPWISEALEMGGFYFSLSMDLTVSLQQALQQRPAAAPVSSAAAAVAATSAAKSGQKETEGDRFLWNRLLLQPLQQHAQTLGMRAIQG